MQKNTKINEELIDRFLELVRVKDGFQLEQVCPDGTAYILGGEGNQVWFVETYKDETINHYVGNLDVDGKQQDACIFRNGGYVLDFDEEPGITLQMIIQRAYAHQNEPWVISQEPEHREEPLPHDHYVSEHNTKILDISSEYRVTIRYTDLGNPEEGFEFGRILCGEELREEEEEMSKNAEVL